MYSYSMAHRGESVNPCVTVVSPNVVENVKNSVETRQVSHPTRELFTVTIGNKLLYTFNMKVTKVSNQPLDSGESVVIPNTGHNLLDTFQVRQFVQVEQFLW